MSSAFAPISPNEWNDQLSCPPNLCSAAANGAWNGALLRRWSGTTPNIDQPALDHHYLVLHMGGPKTVTRRSPYRVATADAQVGSLTLVPAGSSYSWTTEGPIGFAHLYLRPGQVDHVLTEEFDRDPRSVELVDKLGSELPLLSAMLKGMLEQVEHPSFSSRLVLDTLLHSVIVHLLSACSTLSAESTFAQHTMSPRRLRRVLDFIESNLATDIELEDLASVAGSSRFHFSRAFRDATGFPPYRYLIHRRIDAAKTMLLEDELSIAEIAQQCGFKSRSQFAVMFRRVFGTSPGRFRREH
jgi:AraC family transcriptional regulator